MSQPSSLGNGNGNSRGVVSQRPVFSSRPDLGEVGSVLDGRYRIEHVIGEGGMGVVAKATDLRLQRTVAVKLLHSEYADQEDVLERFAREAMVIAKLRSRHVVGVLDVSTDPKNPYLVLEHLEGESLEDRVFREGPLPLGEAVKYCRQIAEALEEAHGAGILHRDIKPANVFLTRQTNHEIIAQLLDFGTARFYDAKRDGQLSKPTITKQYETFGSPAYMPPEQISSARNTDERSDIWALGTVLYEAITGRLAFEGEYPEVFVVISTREPPPVRSLRPEAPQELETIIERCLRKVKEDRYASMTELKRALLSLEQEILPARARPNHTVPSPPQTPPSRPIVPALSPEHPTTPAPPADHLPPVVMPPTPALPFPIYADTISGSRRSSVPEFDDQETYLEQPAGTENGKRKAAVALLLGVLTVVLLVGGLALFRGKDTTDSKVPTAATPSATAAAVPPPEPERPVVPERPAALEPSIAPVASAARPAVSAAQRPTGGGKAVPAVAPQNPTPPAVAPPQPSAAKAPPVVPGGQPIPSGEDIGRRK